MSSTAPGYDSYRPVGADSLEYFLHFGDHGGQQLLLIGSLFEEMNFTRRFLADLGRRVAARGIGVWIPDLPGTGESLRGLDTVVWDDWTAAISGAATHVADATGRVPHIASIRGGAILDGAGEAASRWRFAPASGADLLRQMRRAQALSDKEAGGPAPAPPGTVSLVGYRISEALVAALDAAKLDHAAPAASDRLKTVAAPSGGAPLWRRAEPGHDPTLAATLADDLHAWIQTCAG